MEPEYHERFIVRVWGDWNRPIPRNSVYFDKKSRTFYYLINPKVTEGSSADVDVVTGSKEFAYRLSAELKKKYRVELKHEKIPLSQISA
jgi:hypothetical protein